MNPSNNAAGYKLLCEFEVAGKLPRKSNSRVIATNRSTGKPMLIKSKDARQYGVDFARQITGDLKNGYGSWDQLLAIEVVVYYPSKRQDVSIELLKDEMEKQEIVSNDVFIREHFVYGFIDREAPRVRVRLYEITELRTPPF